MVSMVWDANKYIDVQAPWVLKKTDTERMNTVLYVLMEVMRHVAILYQPLMPTSSNVILDQLGVPEDEREFEHLDKEKGLKWLHGKKASETIERLKHAVNVLGVEKSQDYWASTQGNAGFALSILLKWAKQHPDGRWRVY